MSTITMFEIGQGIRTLGFLVALLVLLLPHVRAGIMCSRGVADWKISMTYCLNNDGIPVSHDELSEHDLNLQNGVNVWTSDYTTIVGSSTSNAHGDDVECGYVEVDETYHYGDVKFADCQGKNYFICGDDSHDDSSYNWQRGTWYKANQCGTNVDKHVMRAIDAPTGHYWTRQMKMTLGPPINTIPSPRMCGYAGSSRTGFAENCSQKFHVLCRFRLNVGHWTFQKCGSVAGQVATHRPSTSSKPPHTRTTMPYPTSSRRTTKASVLTPFTVTKVTGRHSTISVDPANHTSDHTMHGNPTVAPYTQNGDPRKPNTGMVVGVVVASVVAVALIAVMLVFLIRRRSAAIKRRPPDTYNAVQFNNEIPSASSRHHGHSNVSRHGHSNAAYTGCLPKLDNSIYEEVGDPNLARNLVNSAYYMKKQYTKGGSSSVQTNSNLTKPIDSELKLRVQNIKESKDDIYANDNENVDIACQESYENCTIENTNKNANDSLYSSCLPRGDKSGTHISTQNNACYGVQNKPSNGEICPETGSDLGVLRYGHNNMTEDDDDDDDEFWTDGDSFSSVDDLDYANNDDGTTIDGSDHDVNGAHYSNHVTMETGLGNENIMREITVNSEYNNVKDGATGQEDCVSISSGSFDMSDHEYATLPCDMYGSENVTEA